MITWNAPRRPAVAGALFVVLGLAGLAGCAPPPAVPPAKRLTLERLYSLPTLIGTEPRGFAWSADSTRVAFLWNDEGTNFYDVWTVAVDGERPERVTRLPRREAPPEPGADISLRQQAVAAETDSGVSGVWWHPDGRRMVFTFRGDLYSVEAGSEPRRLTETPGPETRPAFAPGSSDLAYLHGGDLWVMDLAGETPGPARRVASIARDAVFVESFRWSPDGRRLALVENDRTAVTVRRIPDYLTEETSFVEIRRPFPGETSDGRRLGVVGADGRDLRWVDLGPERMDVIFGYEWDPAGRQLAVDKSDVFVKDRRILLVDAASLATTLLVRENEPENVTAQWWIAWAPDGEGLYFVSDRDEDYHVYLVPRAGGAPRRITSGDWAVFGATVTPQGVIVVGNEGRPEERHVFSVPLAGGDARRLSVRPGTHAPVVSPDGRHAAVHFSSDEVPPDLFLTRLDVDAADERTERRVTTSPLPEFAEYTWVQPRYVTFRHHLDGTTLHGRLALPPDYRQGQRYPAILGSVYSNTVRNQWGGRTAHPTWGLDQFLLQEGYVLLTVDISGSSGRGKAFRRRIRLDYGGVDVEDLYSGTRYLVDEGIADPGRIGMWGSSYGGLLTTMSLFTKPGVYAAGIAGAPATNVWHALTGEQRVMMRPQEQPEAYANASSHTKAARLQDHLMLVHGMRDSIVLYKDSVTLVQHLMLLEKDVEFVTLPDAQHGWDNEGLYQTRFAFRKMVDFFERHLGRGPTR